MSRTRLVIFDCDGVLVDSEPVANRMLGDVLRELGLDLTQEQIFQKFVGYSMPHCMRVIEDMLGRPPPPDFLRDLQARTFAAFRNELHAMPGIEQTLDTLDAAGVQYCVASSGDHEKMNTTLGITGLLPRFAGRIFSVTQVAHSKPAPDVYLFAARQLGAEPSACVVVEDTPPGVQAGVAAGMTVFGFCAHTPEHRLQVAGAHRTFVDLRRLREMLLEIP
jgi:HAD superfamily hydrolase (TIGR01509 family)